MEHKIILEAFEGPLDLLLNLIEKAKVDIYDIPINIITEQYMEYIYELEELNLDVASDFLILASTLLQIKSRMLLPKEKVLIDGEEIELDPRDELVLQILSYKTFKEVAEQLREIGEVESMAYYKPQEDLSFFDDEEENIGPFDLNQLINSINNILEKKTQLNIDFNISEIEREEYSIKECSEIIVKKLSENKSFKFTDLLQKDTRRNEIIAYFLSILELSKTGYITIKQEEFYGDLIIKKIDLEEQVI